MFHQYNEQVVEVHTRNEDDNNISDAVYDILVMSKPYRANVVANALIKELVGYDSIKIYAISNTLGPEDCGIGAYKVMVSNANATYTIELGDKADDGTVYATISGVNGVLKVSPKLLNTSTHFNAFNCIYKFAHIYRMDDVKSIIYTNASKKHILTIDKNGKHLVDDKVVNDDEFKEAYRAVIGLSFDAPYTGKITTKKVGSVAFNLTDGSTVEYNYYEHDAKTYIVHTVIGDNYLISKSAFDEVNEKLK